jgi:hypothetical protein
LYGVRDQQFDLEWSRLAICHGKQLIELRHALGPWTTTVTSSFFGAIDHNACNVYMPEPSACKAITRRCGAAIAVPSARVKGVAEVDAKR